MIIENLFKPTVVEGSAANDYFTRRKSEEERIAGTRTPVKNKKNPAETDYSKRRAQEKKVHQGVAEGESGMFSKVMGHETTPEAARQIQQQGFKKSHTGIFFNVGNQNYSGGGYGGTVVMAKVSGPIDDILNLEDDNDLPDNLDDFADGEEIANYAREEGYWAWTDGVQFAVLDPRHIQVVKQGVAEGGYPEVDHMPGPTIKRTQTGCKRCHGKGYVYKTPDGEVHPINRPDAKKYKCGKCDGIGFVKVAEQGVAEGSEEGSYSDKFVQSQIDYYTKHVLSGTAADRERINGSLNYYQHIKNKRIKDGTWQEQGVAEEQHSCPHCGGELVSEELMNEKKDACYYKVKSRYKVWPSAYASGALVKCRNKGASNWGNGGKKNESSILEGINQTDESLHDWFNKEKWVRMDTKGNIKGPCAREPGEGKPKCLPQSKAHSLGKKGRAGAAARKRREDPNPERSGKAINVNTKKKSNENIDEDWKKKLGAAALTGAMALGAAGANARVMPGDDPNINRLTGKPIATQQATDTAPAKAEAPKGFSKEYLQKAADPNRFGRFMISIEKAQELLKQGQGQ
jgi:hypothetical protein